MRAAGATASQGRGGSLCIGLLIVAICLQLYVISLWMAPARAPDADLRLSREGTTRCAAASAADSPNKPSAALVSIAAERIASAETNTLADSTSALTALHLLSKFIRMNRDKIDKGTLRALDGAGVSGSDLVVATPDQPIANVGAGALKLGEDKHDHSDHEHGDSKAPHGTKGHIEHADHDHHPGDTHDTEYLAAHPGLYHSMWGNISLSWALDVVKPERHHALPESEKARHNQCMDWLHTHNVKVDAGWGTLPQSLHAKFDELKCSDVISLEVTAKYILEHPELYAKPWPVPADRQVVKAEPGFEDKVIATIVCITTRSLTIRQPEDLALFKDLLPSFVRTVEPGFEYWIYIGYDKGDPWLDNDDHLDLLRNWFASHVTKPLAQRDITCKLVFSTWVNPYRKPGPAFNHVTGVAYADGATFLYRINDDQSFDTPWAKAMVDTLMEMGPPYGVVGPACGQGATHILVVDFVHRTHHEIFPTHYPPSLQAWWMDNWVSQVYGKKRTKRVKQAKITHLTESHGTRYDGYIEIGQYMRGEIIRGRAMFEEYLSHTPGMKEQLDSYRADVFSYSMRR